jgi:hypothetical protein
LARLASSRLTRHAGLRHDGRHPSSGKYRDAPKNNAPDQNPTATLIRWSIQEIRRIATRLAQRRISPAHVIAWSCWRRAHQAEAQRAHFTRNAQL